MEDGDQLLEAFERREVVRLEELLEVDGAVEQEQSLPGFGRLNHRVASNSLLVFVTVITDSTVR